MNITVTLHPSSNPDTLAARLGRQPTNREAADEVRRILQDATIERAGRGELPWQRGRMT